MNFRSSLSLHLSAVLLSCILGACATSSQPQVTKVGSETTKSESASPSSGSSSLDLVPRGIDFSKAPQVVAFGSCANQDKPQPLWNTIAKHEPDLFLFMGDNVYAVAPAQRPVAEQYKKLSQNPDYRSFREKFPVMAIWDDNDFGQKDGGADNPEKEIYKKEFLKHFPYVKDSISWNQGGLYHVKYVGGTTTTTGRRRKRVVSKEPVLQVIMLDTRYYRGPIQHVNDPNMPLKTIEPWPESDKSKTMLGEEQWAWLEDQLDRPADLRFIVSGIQVIANEHGFEKWGNFPAERQRLFDLIKKKNLRNVVFLSGDRHFGAIAKFDIKGLGPVFDITASAINRPSDLDEKDPAYLGSPIKGENFGVALIDWKKRRVKFELRDLNDQVANSVDFKF